jgi:hypothetical protein
LNRVSPWLKAMLHANKGDLYFYGRVVFME